MVTPSPPIQGPSGRLPGPVLALLSAAAVVVTLAGIREVSGIVGPSFLALVLVVTLHPIRAAMRRRGAPEWVAVTALLLAAYTVLLALVAAIVLSASQLGLLLPDYSSQVQDLAAQAARALEPIGVTQAQVIAVVNDIDLSSFVVGLRPLLGGATSVASSLLLVLVLILFLGLEAPGFEAKLSGAAVRPELVEALAAFVRRTRRYVAVSTVFGLVVAVVDVAALYAIGVPLALVWGVLSFVTNYIPNVGFLLGLGPPALVALLEGGVGAMIAVIVAYAVANFAIQSVIQPKVVGDAVGLSATVTFLSVVFWAVLMGPLGGFLAIPLTLLVKALFIDADPSTRWLGRLIGERDG